MMPIISSSSSRILLSLPDVKGNGLDYRVLNGPAGSARIKYGFSKAHRLQPLRMAASSSGSGPRLDVVDSLSPVPLMSSLRQPTVAAKKMQTVLIGLEPSTIQLGPMTRASSKPLEPVCTIGKTKSMSKKTSERSAKDLCPIDGYVHYTSSVFFVSDRLSNQFPFINVDFQWFR
jgi:hypothetical protein